MKKFTKPNDNTIQQNESEILEFWKINKIFEKSVESKPKDNQYFFYDGPPFISGLPHYGHLLGSIAKDIIPRYWTMKGKRVERLWGWDAHGLTVENKVQAKLGIKNRRDIESFGLEKFTEECYKYTSEISAEWNWYIDKIGRWVDIDNAYKTIDRSYMESVMWVFKELYNKGLIYEGVRTSLYCTTCGTPVSNFEVAMDDTYKDVEDPAITVKFDLNYYKTGQGVGVVIFNEKNEILMSVRQAEGRERVHGIVGGRFEDGETDPIEVAKRECLEELQVVPEKIEVVGSSIDVFESRIYQTYHVKAFLNSKTKLSPNEEHGELKWVKQDDIPWSNIHIPTKNSIKEVLGLKKFPKITENHPKVYALAWTTTPWTIPSNRALVVDDSADYVTVKVKSEFYIVAKERFEEVFKGVEGSEIYDEYKGKELVNLSYKPIYDFFAKKSEGEFKIYKFESMVNVNDGTGIVHSAPGFGDVDTKMGQHYGLRVMLTIDDEGKFVEGDAGENPFVGMYYAKANKYILEDLEKRGVLFKNEKIVHRFPYHDRCNTLLIQKAQNSWFIKVSELKDKLLKENENINWVPDHLKYGRFAKGIEQAPDWCISRTRFWATPMPVWESADGDRIVVSSVKEIEELSGQKVKDLHRPYIDEIVFKKNGKEYKRRTEVLDSWMEAGSMPYGQIHYPYENEDKFKNTFPADYIVEYIGQVRAWFYVMHVLSVALFKTNSFKNVISTGVLSGNDGRKMSKTYGNYTDSKIVLEQIGGDALRLYLMGSPLMIGDNANFDDKELKNKLNNVLNPLWNTAKFFLIYAELKKYVPDKQVVSNNLLDKWIISRLNEFIRDFATNIEKYNVPMAVRPIEKFVEDLSTWYLRRSRSRMQDEASQQAFATLYYVLLTFSKAAAPIIPFIAEKMYKELSKVDGWYDFKESVHLEDYPDFSEDLIDKDLLAKMDIVRQIASVGNSVRKEKNIPVKQPLKTLYYMSEKPLETEFVELIKDELNIKEVIQQIAHDEDTLQKRNNGILVGGSVKNYDEKWVTDNVLIDVKVYDDLKVEANARELIREIQKLRKESDVAWDAKIKVEYKNTDEYNKAIEKFKDEIMKKTLTTELIASDEFKVIS